MTDDERWPDGWETHYCPNARDDQGNMKLVTHSIHYHDQPEDVVAQIQNDAVYITDEELLEMESHYEDRYPDAVGVVWNDQQVIRLIAALRSSRAEVERLQSELVDAEADAEAWRKQAIHGCSECKPL